MVRMHQMARKRGLNGSALNKKTQEYQLLKGNGAAYRIRTYDPRITNAMLYQLS